MSRARSRVRVLPGALVLAVAGALLAAPLAAATTETPTPTTEPEVTTTAEPVPSAPTEPLPTPTTNVYAVGQSVQFRMNADGQPNSSVTDLRWAVTQITVQGPDAEALEVPVPEQSLALRSLLDFSNPPQQDGIATYDVSVSDGYGLARSVGLVPADYQLPVAIDVAFTLDGQPVSAGELVGKSGVVTAQYTVRNLTRSTVDVPITATGSGEQVVVPTEADVPMVVIAKTLLPQRYTGLDTGIGQFGADGRGNNQVQWIALPFSPLAKDGTSTFGWAANVTDAVIPSMLVQVAPLYMPPQPAEGEAAAQQSAGRAPVPGLDPVVAEIQAGLAQVAQGLDGFANSNNPDPLAELEQKLNNFFQQFSANIANISTTVDPDNPDGAVTGIDEALGTLDEVIPVLEQVAAAAPDIRALADRLQDPEFRQSLESLQGSAFQALCGRAETEGAVPAGTCQAVAQLSASLLAANTNDIAALAGALEGITAVLVRELDALVGVFTNLRAQLVQLSADLTVISQGLAEQTVDLPPIDAVVNQIVADVVTSPNGQLVTGGLDQVSAGVGQAKVIVSDYVASAIAQIQSAGANAAATTDTVKAEMGGISVAAQASPLPYGGDPANAPAGTVLSGAYEFRLDAADTNAPDTPARILVGLVILLAAGGMSYLVARKT